LTVGNVLESLDRCAGQIPFETFLEIIAYKMGSKDPRDLLLSCYDEMKGDTGSISIGDLRRVASEIGENISEEELQQMMDEADEDGDGYINRDEFIKILNCD
jgi:centrin-1